MDQRPDQGSLGGRIAHRQALVGGDDARHQRVDHAAVRDDAAQRRAALPGGACGGEHDAAHREIEVGRRGDDGGVVAAELQQHLAEPLGHARADLLAHPDRPRRTHQRDTRIVHQLLADLTATQDQARNGTGNPDVSRCAFQQRLAGDGGQRVSSEGFHTTVSPHTNAMAAFQAQTATGKLNAVMTPTTPRGARSP